MYWEPWTAGGLARGYVEHVSGHADDADLAEAGDAPPPALADRTGAARRLGHGHRPDGRGGSAARPDRDRPAMGPHAPRDGHGAAQPAGLRLVQDPRFARGHGDDPVPADVRIRGGGPPECRLPARG